MKNNQILTVLTVLILFFIPKLGYAQMPNYGAAGNFVFFTTTGAISGGGAVSHITGGDIGTNSGAVSGFGSTTMSGTMHRGDALTIQAAKDLQSAYDSLKKLPATTISHGATFGGETLSSGVYNINEATNIIGTLTLDGQNNPNSVFIFLISGGALTSGNTASIILINGASACNVAWAVNGAVSFGTYSSMQGTFIAKDGAFTMKAGSTLVGRGYSTTGALSFDAVSVCIPSQCSDYIATTWTGVSTDWNNAANWNNSIIPTATTKLTIPTNTNNLYPVINSNNDTVENLIINSGASLTIGAGGSLRIGGSISNAGTLDATAGTIEFMGYSPQTIAAQTFVNNTVKNLIISNNEVSLAGQQNITGSLSFGSSNDTLYTSDNLVLKSSAAATASVGDITKGGTQTGNAIKGSVSIERYISAKRAWRLLSAPIVSSSLTTINTAWQEGVTSTDPNPGYGTQITGGTSANGFDQGINSFSSIKLFNSVTNLFQNLPAATGTNTPITASPGYFLFIRGNRSTNLLQGAAAALTPTILRMKGTINTGDTIMQTNAANFTLLGNPYPAPVNFHTLTKTNVNDIMYVWDPNLAGANGIGGYVAFIWNSNTGNYDSTQSVSPVSRYIQSGEAFFVPSNGVAGSIKFSEINKDAGGSDHVFREMGVTKNVALRVNLFAINADSTTYLSDGVLTNYNDNNLNLVDNNDALKLSNSAESICIARDGKKLSIERRLTISGNDTTFLNLLKLKTQTYKLQFKAEGLNTGLHAVLKDNYLGSLKDTAINFDGITEIVFKVNTDPASFAANRFSIVFNQEKQIIPYSFFKVKASNEQNDIKVEWTIKNEFKLKSFVVESSRDGIVFTDATTILPTDNTGNTASYFWLDLSVTAGLHFYRIKATDIDGKVSYSTIVNVTLSVNGNDKFIRQNSNNAKSNDVSIYLHNIDSGNYTLKIYSMDGRMYKQFNYDHTGGTTIHNFSNINYMPSGIYQLILSNNGISFKTSFIKD